MLGRKRKLKKLSKSEPSFLSKLYQILSEKDYSQYIHWSHDGLSVIISDPTGLTKKVLPKFYNHHNYASFVRQLNIIFTKFAQTPKATNKNMPTVNFIKAKRPKKFRKFDEK